MRKILLFAFVLGFAYSGFAQCVAPGTQTGSTSGCTRSIYYYGEIVPIYGSDSINWVSNYSPGEYFEMPVLPNACYTVTTCGAGINTHVNVFEAAMTSSPYAYNDDDGPECSGQEASVEFVPNFNNYASIDIREFNCLPNGSSSITIGVRQNNNLMFTSSSAGVCQGETRTLTAFPNPVGSSQPNAGDLGTFSGTGVSGNTFTPPVPAGDSATHTITYTYGYCSITQDLTVYHTPSTAVAGTDFTTGCDDTTANLAGNSPTFGTGTWTVVSGTGTATTPNSPTSTVTGLTPGTQSTFRWTIANGTCTPSTSDITITVPASPAVNFNNSVDSVCAGSSPITLNGESPVGGTFNGIGVTGNTFDPTLLPPGLYTLTYDYTDTSNGCSATAYDSIRVSACLGIEDLAASDINIYPNPSSGLFNVSINNNATGEINLYIVNLQGQVIYRSRLNKEASTVVKEVDISEQSPSVYFLNVLFEGGGRITKRIIKE